MPAEYKVIRFAENPIIAPAMMGNSRENINGPSLIKVPSWVDRRLGNYYLYFAHHEGQYIRLAYADDLHGPWRIHAPGVLPVKAMNWSPEHIASPDALIDEDRQEIRLYVHAPTGGAIYHHTDPRYRATADDSVQDSFVALSRDGLDFQLLPDIIGKSKGRDHSWYLRVWKWQGCYYAMARGGRPLYRSADGITFETAARSPFDDNPEFKKIRHIAVQVEGNALTVFYSRIGDTPEHILMSKVNLTPDWEHWQASQPVSVLFPETEYEGSHLPLVPSQVGMTGDPVRELRDPAVYSEEGRTYLLYTIQGEYGIAMAELQANVQPGPGGRGRVCQAPGS